MTKAKAIMVQGTASDVGKSMICTALCRIFSNDGYKVVPFKSQNMALNSYITQDGGEIGRAQGVQAEAARIQATTHMNPILLKPKQDMVSEVVLHGKHYLDMNAKTYRSHFVEQVMPEVENSVRYLQANYEVIVLEGAGSPAEINLKARDIANMRMAHLADAAVILVADIDRGGVFASIIGTLALLDDAERARVKGFVINKFRGMKELLDDGLEWLEQETGIPVLGVIPYLAIEIDAEDSLALSSLRLKKPKPGEFALDVAMIQLPRISNFTDIDPLFEEPGVGVRIVKSVTELGNPDLLILPGTKNTIDDLQWLKQTGLGAAIVALYQAGTKIVGICGGYQMLGEVLIDTEGIEGDGSTAQGLGLLPIETVFFPEKQTVQVAGIILATNEEVTGYEIHLGRTTLKEGATPFVKMADGRLDGAITADGQVIGTYLHGIFHNRHLTRRLINELRVQKGLAPLALAIKTDTELRDEAYERLDQHVRAHLDMDKLYTILHETNTIK
ncbi:cobyric acid synthase [Metasolibacillus meyeri]|uniref:Cobyric acid synthase n=1 Tax=Metasolibacillus meyeri TaxID=1071052 RepID=A0AAW9NPC4_9BACL|nr:cobyric acid synthase [Metasolibacillus meyeri]MEC1177114.1 cobyric acid synthase [Metasolibacillus meyeri]